MELLATGTFDVKMTPLTFEGRGSDSLLGRMSIDKRFSGDLSGSSQGQMLSAGTGTLGSAGYVAMEVVTGSLNGRHGSFVLQHTGTMNRGQPQLSVTVVPDSGTGELAGLEGRLSIDKAGGTHRYEFRYSLRVA